MLNITKFFPLFSPVFETNEFN